MTENFLDVFFVLKKIDKFYIISKLVRNVRGAMMEILLSIQTKVQVSDFSDEGKTNNETDKINKENKNEFCNLLLTKKTENIKHGKQNTSKPGKTFVAIKTS